MMMQTDDGANENMFINLAKEEILDIMIND